MSEDEQKMQVLSDMGAVTIDSVGEWWKEQE
jgi:hypothetical protein